MRHEIDHIDEQIIKLLHNNARIPLKSIANQVFLSSPAVSARIERVGTGRKLSWDTPQK